MAQPTPVQTASRKTVLTVVIIVLVLAVAPYVPGLRSFGGLLPQHLTALAHLTASTGSPAASGPSISKVPATNTPTLNGLLQRTKLKPNHTAPVSDQNYLADPTGALDHFYEALARTASKEPHATTLILHFGDSPVTADSITADARANLQSRFGDAGHGYVLIAKPWAWYGHRGIDLKAHGWKIEAATQGRAKDGVHGLAGVSFTGSAGATSQVTLPDNQHTHMQVYYWKQPSGGSFEVKTETSTIGTVQTEAADKAPGFFEADLPPATSRIFLTVTSGTVRLFGFSFEKPGPGVIYSSLGLNGAQVQAVLRFFELGQWTAQLQHQHPDLVIINYGTNESIFPSYIEKDYPGELHKLIQRIQAALPGTSLLIMSPMDRGQRDSSGQIVTPPILQRIVDIQRQTALDLNCAFFDTFDAMGGAGTMGTWYNSQPRLVSADFMHPLPAGAAKVGALLDLALTAGFDRSQHPGQSSEKQTTQTELPLKKP